LAKVTQLLGREKSSVSCKCVLCFDKLALALSVPPHPFSSPHNPPSPACARSRKIHKPGEVNDSVRLDSLGKRVDLHLLSSLGFPDPVLLAWHENPSIRIRPSINYLLILQYWDLNLRS
jgi:hypothetical protein